MEKFKNRIASVLAAAGLSANFLTAGGLGCALAAGIFIYQGFFFWGAVWLLLSGILDLMDGAVARLSKTTSPFGGILDSSMDRYGDGFIFAGLFLFCERHGSHGYALLAVSAWIGSFLISYARSRAECVIPNCRVGFWERGERIVYIVLGLLFNNIALVLWVLAFATHQTVFLRLVYSKKESEDPGYWGRHPTWFSDLVFQKTGRADKVYYMKITALFLVVLFLRISLKKS